MPQEEEWYKIVSQWINFEFRDKVLTLTPNSSEEGKAVFDEFVLKNKKYWLGLIDKTGQHTKKFVEEKIEKMCFPNVQEVYFYGNSGGIYYTKEINHLLKREEYRNNPEFANFDAPDDKLLNISVTKKDEDGTVTTLTSLICSGEACWLVEKKIVTSDGVTTCSIIYSGNGTEILLKDTNALFLFQPQPQEASSANLGDVSEEFEKLQQNSFTVNGEDKTPQQLYLTSLFPRFAIISTDGNLFSRLELSDGARVKKLESYKIELDSDGNFVVDGKSVLSSCSLEDFFEGLDYLERVSDYWQVKPEENENGRFIPKGQIIR